MVKKMLSLRNDDEREIIRWIRDCIEKGFDFEEIERKLREDKFSEDIIGVCKDIYEVEIEEREKVEIKLWDKIKLRRLLGKSKKKLNEVIKYLKEIREDIKVVDENEQKKLNDLKEEMVIAIIGNQDKGIEGLLSIFEASDEKTGENVTFTSGELRDMSLDEVMDIFEDLIYELEKNI